MFMATGKSKFKWSREKTSSSLVLEEPSRVDKTYDPIVCSVQETHVGSWGAKTLLLPQAESGCLLINVWSKNKGTNTISIFWTWGCHFLVSPSSCQLVIGWICRELLRRIKVQPAAFSACSWSLALLRTCQGGELWQFAGASRNGRKPEPSREPRHAGSRQNVQRNSPAVPGTCWPNALGQGWYFCLSTGARPSSPWAISALTEPASLGRGQCRGSAEKNKTRVQRCCAGSCGSESQSRAQVFRWHTTRRLHDKQTGQQNPDLICIWVFLLSGLRSTTPTVVRQIRAWGWPLPLTKWLSLDKWPLWASFSLSESLWET